MSSLKRLFALREKLCFLMTTKIIHLVEADSTNNYLHGYEQSDDDADIVVAWTDYQTAGRGQGTNTWESERGKNLTFSIKLWPVGVRASLQYVLLEAGALAVRDVLSLFADDITVKWPNDIYWRDSKISGTLSECTVHSGYVTSCVIGTGVNVNQRVFRGNAPNPVSLIHIVDGETDRETLLGMIVERFEEYAEKVNVGDYDFIHRKYLQSLYRGTGMHRYADEKGEFVAEISDVAPDGRLTLRLADGTARTYLFKEVRFVVPSSRQNAAQHAPKQGDTV